MGLLCNALKYIIEPSSAITLNISIFMFGFKQTCGSISHALNIAHHVDHLHGINRCSHQAINLYVVIEYL